MRTAEILVVENEQLVAEDLKRALESLGYSVPAVVAQGKKALRRLEKRLPDLVLMDIVLDGELSGIQTAQRIRRRWDLPVIYISAYSDPETVRSARSTEPYGYILKPIDERELRVTIELCLYKHASEKKLKERQERLRHFIDPATDTFCLLDSRFRVVEMNKTGLNNWRIKKSDLRKKDVFELLLKVPEEEKAGWRMSLADTLSTGMSFTMNHVRIPAEGGERIVNIRAAKAADAIGLIITDVSERRQAEEELNRSREQLRNLSRHLQLIREEESKRISREIHDELGQALTALKMDISWLSARIPEDSADRKAIIEKMRSMSSLIDGTIQIVQKVSAELRPGMLDDLGLVPAIEWQAQEFQKRTAIDCVINLDGEPMDLDSERSTAVFRVFQEALTNVARHARASRVTISLKKAAGKLELRVGDDGIGIPEEALSASDSLGLMGMRERLLPLGGELRISRGSEKGTKLFVSVPLKDAGER